jgi:nitroreductase
MKEVMNFILKRRSVREFMERKVEDEDITILLESAMAAPSSCDRKPWEYIVVNDKQLLARIDSKLGGGVYKAPLIIVVCGNMDLTKCDTCDCGNPQDSCREFWIQDCSASMENLLIAASGIGLGGVWVGAFPNNYVVRTLSKILKMPENIIPLGIACIGYPRENPEARTQYSESKVHWQKY